MTNQMETFDARLASFDLVLRPDKRRSSATKSSKPIAWPLSSPSPAEFAHAGFYYNPYETNPDNATCYLCERSLDGWEEDDNPIEEHLRHSADCGWAIMMDIQQHSSNPAEIEDPTSEKIAQARQATFGLMWPYDGKRGWVCQSEKMVDGGWYFCPAEDSDDLASCPYCKLSLDGWEPKDDPYHEHHRRSPDCSFFVFAQPPGKKTKGSRAKKTRASKGSRVSTQSVATTTSEAPSMDLDDHIDQSILSQSTTASKKTKKPSKAKAKARAKRDDSEDAGSQMDVDSTDNAQPEPPKPKRATRGKKRSSDIANRDEHDQGDKEAGEPSEPAPKRRATRTRNSAAQGSHDEYHTLKEPQVPDEPVPQKEKPKRGRPSKKASTKGRKASQISTNSGTTSKSRIPRDSEIDAALEADLEGGVPGPDHSVEPASKPRKASNSSEKALTEPTEAVDPEEHAAFEPDQEAELPARKQKPNKATGKRESTQSEDDNMDKEFHDAQASPPTKAADINEQQSYMSVEMNADAEGEPKSKKGRKKAETGKDKKSKKAAAAPESETGEVEGAEQPESRHHSNQQPEADIDMHEQHETQRDSDRPSRRRSSMAPPKTTERYSDIPQEKQFTRSFTGTRVSNASSQEGPSPPGRKSAMSPLPSAPKQQSLSPQSSDAENQPPSTRPSTSRPVLSPSKKQLAQTPTGQTPSPSKHDTNTGGLKTSHPWVPIDIDEILFAASSDKENANANGPLGGAKGELTSPEKRMTVEQWVYWNAKNGEDRLKRECERLVGHFEREGGRAMRVLEGIECID